MSRRIWLLCVCWNCLINATKKERKKERSEKKKKTLVPMNGVLMNRERDIIREREKERERERERGKDGGRERDVRALSVIDALFVWRTHIGKNPMRGRKRPNVGISIQLRL
jgi:hypothetical protein